jgi:hypothetical protein
MCRPPKRVGILVNNVNLWTKSGALKAGLVKPDNYENNARSQSLDNRIAQHVATRYTDCTFSAPQVPAVSSVSFVGGSL